MRLAGTSTRWFYAIFLVFVSWTVYLRATHETVRFTPYVFAFLFPLATGTGLITAAKAGRFDLLFGAGESRRRIWWAAFTSSWVIPSTFVVAIFVLSDAWRAVGRLPALLLFAGGIAFAGGLLEMRYTVGVLWLLSRSIFLLTIGAMERTIAINRGELPSPGTVALMILAAPELLLERLLPIPWLIAAAVVGLAALAASFFWFCRSDLGGKRS